MSNYASTGPSSVRPVSHAGDEMKGLLEQQAKIKRWLAEVHTKIYKLEEAYLEETPMGNIIHGWDIDNKTNFKYKGQEDKERLFSCSSYHTHVDRKIAPETLSEAVGEKRSHHAASGSNSKASEGTKSKKVKKSHSKKGAEMYDEWDNEADY